MLSWLRCFPHDAMERKHSTKPRRSASTCSTATSYKSSSNAAAAAAARIVRCTTAAASARASFGRECSSHGDINHSASSSPPPPAAYNHSVISARVFSFRELAAATGNFRQDNLIGEGGFGRVYKGLIQLSNSSTGEQQAVAVKQLDRNGLQGNREFLVEVLVLTGLLHHPNLVDLLGYCADGNQRLLVYHLMPLGSLEDHLLDHRTTNKPPLPWRTRMKIAHGAAKGLEYLHETASPPVIYRDLKSSNILLDEGYNPRLSDFGLAMLLAPATTTCNRNADQDESSSSRAMGTYGYCAPEYVRTGHLTVKSDVYSFGVVLLELITGRRAIDTTRPQGEQNLVGWAAPMFGDQKRFHELVDPLLLLQGDGDGYRPCNKDLNQAVAVAAMCLQEDDSVRPIMTDVVMALSFLAKDT